MYALCYNNNTNTTDFSLELLSADNTIVTVMQPSCEQNVGLFAPTSPRPLFAKMFSDVIFYAVDYQSVEQKLTIIMFARAVAPKKLDIGILRLRIYVSDLAPRCRLLGGYRFSSHPGTGNCRPNFDIQEGQTLFKHLVG